MAMQWNGHWSWGAQPGRTRPLRLAPREGGRKTAARRLELGAKRTTTRSSTEELRVLGTDWWSRAARPGGSQIGESWRQSPERMATTAAVEQQLLTPAEIARFKRDGFLIKRNVLDPELCAAARDALWAANDVPHAIQRGNPSSWIGPWKFQDEARTGDNIRKHYRWHCNADGLGGSPLFVDLVGGATHRFAQQLLGAEETTAPGGSGGVYATLPRGKVGQRRPYISHPLQAHCDSSLEGRGRLGVVGYIDDVPPGGGAFGLWAGSHERVFRLYRDQRKGGPPPPGRDDLRGVQAGSYTPELYAELDRILADTPVTDTWAHAGDVVIYHAKLMHVPMFNHGSVIRQAVITGFGKTEESLPDEELFAHVDEADLWRDWSPEVRAIPADLWEAAVAARL